MSLTKLTDTIAAPITGTQPAAVAWIRLSGPEAWAVASRVFLAWPKAVTPRLAVYGRYGFGDDGLVLPFLAGHSYTGEESVEMSIHGSPASLKALLEACYAAGARPAEPGEFTQRAFMNGRLDLAQAEAVRETIEARTALQLKQATRQLEGSAGSISAELQGVMDAIIFVIASIEATVDFSEEVGDLDLPATLSGLDSVRLRLGSLLEQAERSRWIREGVRVAITGPPNVGKSSLLNAILGYHRAIVSPIPGTTRDSIEESIDLNGLLVRFIDTAGIRESEDPIEQEGIQIARAEQGRADIVLSLKDLSQPTLTPPEVAEGVRAIEVFTKLDLMPDTPVPGLAVSAKTGAGLDELLGLIRSLPGDWDDLAPVYARHVPSLQGALESVGQARDSIAQELPPDLSVTFLREAMHHLGLITGETAPDELLDRIFSSFCIGK